MKRVSISLLIGAATVLATWAQQLAPVQQPALPVKGILRGVSRPDDKAGTVVKVIIRLYDQQFGGSLLFQEQQSVAVAHDGIFVAMAGAATQNGVPARITDQHATVWADYSLAAAAGINLANGRQQITHRRSDFSPSAIAIDPSLCFSCGGAWPIFAGAFTPGVNNPTERGSGCSDVLTVRTDSRPFLCSR